MQLSTKHKQFADSYIQSRNASEAYRIAYGDKAETVVNASASRLLRNVKIRDYIVKVQTTKLTKTAEKQDITRSFLIQQYLEVLEKAKEQSSTLNVAKNTLDSLAHISGLWLDKRTLEVSGAVNHLASLDTGDLIEALNIAQPVSDCSDPNAEPVAINGEYRNVADA